MRAVRKSSPGPGLELVDVETPRPGPGEVRIRVRRAGICGTDLHIHDWDRWSRGRIEPPLILGHEFMGVVEETGDLVDSPSPGTRVSAEGHIVCGRCEHCRTGDAHVCRDTSILGIDRDGAFADRVVVPAENIVRIPDGVSDDHAAVFDPLGNAFHTVLHTPVSGKTVAVVGCGPIGLFAVGIARAAGAAKVIALEPVEARREIAREMGAHLVLDPIEEDVVEAVGAVTDGYGAHVVCEMSGHPDGIRDCFRICRSAGEVRLLGLPEEPVEVDLSDEVIFRGLSVYGVIGRRMYGTWHQMRDFLAADLLDIEPVITHRLPLEEFQDGIAAMDAGDAAKVVLEVT